MCGICGFLDLGGGASARIETLARQMAASLAHRGPDGDGIWADPQAGVGLGHRRLAIVDLTAAGAQPMISRSERFVLTYNGELYNFRELRSELASAGHGFRGASDTEVLLEACAQWGLERTLPRLNGIFAFALWDRHERKLHLVRDQMGVKPLYWSRQGSLVLFGSELKALSAHPDFAPAIDRGALASFFRFGYVPAPHAIWRGVRKLEPGCWLTISADGEIRSETYWDLRAVARAGVAARNGPVSANAVDALEALLQKAVGRQLVSDVPLGAFLSGGVDSSTVAALMMRAAGSERVRTFSIGFDDAGFDEARHARAVANHLGTDHTEFYVSDADLLEVVPKLPDIFDEPFADASQIPTHLLSRLTRSRVTVALSGDGGDELFGGYNRHLWAHRSWRVLERLPRAARAAAGALIGSLGPRGIVRLEALLPEALRAPQLAEKMAKIAETIASENSGALYRRLVSQWQDPGEVVIGAEEPRGPADDAVLAAEFPDLLDRMQLLDALTYLPDGVLTKVDRAAMAVGLEVRVPLLDPEVVALAWRTPAHLKIRGRTTKWLLRQVLHRYVPAALVERPKMGFTPPLASWLAGPLRDWAEDLLDESRLRAGGLIDPVPVRARWREHLTGRRDGSRAIWPVLVFEAWRERWAGSPRAERRRAVAACF